MNYLKDLETKHRELLSDFENEKEARRAWQDKARTWEHENCRLLQAMVRCHVPHGDVLLTDSDRATIALH